MSMKQGWGSADPGKKSAPKASAPRKISSSAVAVSPSPSGKHSESIEIRPIENGYIIRKSSYGGKKGYESKEHFSAKKPDIEV